MLNAPQSAASNGFIDLFIIGSTLVFFLWLVEEILLYRLNLEVL